MKGFARPVMPCPENAPRKSLGRRVGDTLGFAVIIVAVVWVIMEAVKLVFRPITWLWKSDEELGGVRSEKERIEDRTAKRETFAQDESDPMNQYITRFVDEPTSHLGDSKNEQYQNWYEQWKAGKVFDPELRWAPEVYEQSANTRKLSVRFLDYLGTQVELAESQDTGSFLKTIQKYYPEFTPSLGTMKKEIDELRGREKHLVQRESMVAELNKAGIPEEVAIALGALKLDKEELRVRVALARKWTEKGYDSNVVKLLALHNVSDEDIAAIANTLDGMEIDPQIAVDLFEGRLYLEDVVQLQEFSKNFIETFGESAFAPSQENPDKSMLQAAIELETANVRRAHRSKLRGQAWK